MTWGWESCWPTSSSRRNGGLGEEVLRHDRQVAPISCPEATYWAFFTMRRWDTAWDGVKPTHS